MPIKFANLFNVVILYSLVTSPPQPLLVISIRPSNYGRIFMKDATNLLFNRTPTHIQALFDSNDMTFEFGMHNLVDFHLRVDIVHANSSERVNKVNVLRPFEMTEVNSDMQHEGRSMVLRCGKLPLRSAGEQGVYFNLAITPEADANDEGKRLFEKTEWRVEQQYALMSQKIHNADDILDSQMGYLLYGDMKEEKNSTYIDNMPKISFADRHKAYMLLGMSIAQNARIERELCM